MVQTRREAPPARRPAEAEPGATMIYKPRSAASPQPTEAASPSTSASQREVAVLDAGTASATRSRSAGVVLGRSKDADLQVPDPNVSRRHAELRQEGATYWLVDLDSTNGDRGRRQARRSG